MNNAMNMGVLNDLILTDKGESSEEHVYHNITVDTRRPESRSFVKPRGSVSQGSWQGKGGRASVTFQAQRRRSEHLPPRTAGRITGSE